MGVETSIVPERMLEGSVIVREPPANIAANELSGAASGSLLSLEQL